MADDEVVVVTGGAGFLGQHIVKQLLEQKEFPIGEVRVFDIRPLEWCHELVEGDTTRVPLRQYQGDISNQTDLLEAFKGATVVIHNASIIDTSSGPDTERLHKINVFGTANVIEACVSNNIRYLLYTSSAIAERRIGAYGTTKRQAEDLIHGANGRTLPNSGTLRSCSLRPTAIFGEADTEAILHALVLQIRGTTFYRTGDDCPRFQAAYAGNIAHAFVAATRRLRDTALDGGTNLRNPEGLSINVADDTPITSYSRFMEPFASSVANAVSSQFYIPFWFLFLAANICEWFSYLMKPFCRISLPLSKLGVICMCQLPIVPADEAKMYLGYSPLYSYETAFSKSTKYYRNAYKLKKG